MPSTFWSKPVFKKSDQIKEIASIIENGMDLMTEFDEVLFESLVEKIIVKDQITLEFHLYGGLKFIERLV
ncbi:hypothetical protein [Ruminococcus sp.]|uniref:hypothetical protein n=1 Tax=Ruminococcus sp. TaxID=41978 RepID=UPI0025F8082D|nr:hypothetical protein [Ruminococcus sp.]